jgi:hypothetical protein
LRLRPYFFDDVARPETGVQRATVEAVADLRLDAMDRVLTAADLNGWADKDLTCWRQVFTRAFEKAPVLCFTYLEVPVDYPSLEGIAKAGCGLR